MKVFFNSSVLTITSDSPLSSNRHPSAAFSVPPLPFDFNLTFFLSFFTPVTTEGRHIENVNVLLDGGTRVICCVGTRIFERKEQTRASLVTFGILISCSTHGTRWSEGSLPRDHRRLFIKGTRQTCTNILFDSTTSTHQLLVIPLAIKHRACLAGAMSLLYKSYPCVVPFLSETSRWILGNDMVLWLTLHTQRFFEAVQPSLVLPSPLLLSLSLHGRCFVISLARWMRWNVLREARFAICRIRCPPHKPQALVEQSFRGVQ
ncbi:hypothetical protein CVT24_009966 [Panaeolus cyanescens]|uniref:Uncharacterized protein n=1 Tax=Panaeolus cyanescens TaxID=181874 RepID=A0A409VXF4_9AGAR|nr:hypothetical protein CVT24_009966 [Panaeolus cyanescens]